MTLWVEISISPLTCLLCIWSTKIINTTSFALLSSQNACPNPRLHWSCLLLPIGKSLPLVLSVCLKYMFWSLLHTVQGMDLSLYVHLINCSRTFLENTIFYWIDLGALLKTNHLRFCRLKVSSFICLSILIQTLSI